MWINFVTLTYVAIKYWVQIYQVLLCKELIIKHCIDGQRNRKLHESCDSPGGTGLSSVDVDPSSEAKWRPSQSCGNSRLTWLDHVMPRLLSHPSSLLLGIWSPGFAVITSVKHLTLRSSHRIWTHEWTPTPAQNSFMILGIWELFHNECVSYSLNRETSVLTLLPAWPSGTKFLHNFIFTPHSLDSA